MRRSLQVRISDEEFAHYADVVPTPGSRKGIAVFPVEILRSHPWPGELEARVTETLTDKPVVLIFGRKDPALASDSIIGHWKATFPDATHIDLPDAGHSIQKDAPDEIRCTSARACWFVWLTSGPGDPRRSARALTSRVEVSDVAT
jgi:pimeloyl-ACP methyl ester carboxylesterase